MKKTILQALFGVFIVGGLLVGFRDQITKVWAAPDKIHEVGQKVDEQSEVQQQLASLMTSQQKQLDIQQKQYEIQQVQLTASQEVTKAQIDSLKEIVKDSKKK